MKTTTLETHLKKLKSLAIKHGRDEGALRVDPAAFQTFRLQYEAAAAAAAQPMDERERAPLLVGGSGSSSGNNSSSSRSGTWWKSSLGLAHA